MSIVSTPAGVGGAAARRSVEKLTTRTTDWTGNGFRLALLFGLSIAVLALLAVMYDVIVDGVPYLSDRGTEFITERESSRSSEYGIFNGLRGTFWIGVFVVLFSFPIGIGAAIYLEEYAPDNRLKRIIETNIRNLAGVPSVVYGIFGLIIFVQWMDGFFPNSVEQHLGQTTAAAGATLAVLVLPIVIITSAEAIRAVPRSLREAGYGVGATKWEIVKDHVLPYAAPGIFTGTLLSLARALGEAAPLILIGGVTGRLGSRSGLFDLDQLGEQFMAMPLLIAELAKQPNTVGQWNEATAAAIICLLVVVLLANLIAITLRNRFEKKRG